MTDEGGGTNEVSGDEWFVGDSPGAVHHVAMGACIHVCVRWVLYCCGWCESRPERRVGKLHRWLLVEPELLA